MQTLQNYHIAGITNSGSIAADRIASGYHIQLVEHVGIVEFIVGVSAVAQK